MPTPIVDKNSYGRLRGKYAPVGSDLAKDLSPLDLEKAIPYLQDYINIIEAEDVPNIPDLEGEPQLVPPEEPFLSPKNMERAKLGAGVLGAGAVAKGITDPNMVNAISGPGTFLSEATSPANMAGYAQSAYPLYVAGRSAAEIYDQSQNPNTDLAKALTEELRNYNDSPGLKSAVNFPKTGEESGKIIGENVVPKTATNLLNTLVKTLTGGIKGVVGGIKPITETGSTAIRDVQGSLNSLIRDEQGNLNPMASLFGNIAMMSDKGRESDALVAALTGQPLRSNNIVGSDPYLIQLDSQAKSIINKSIQSRTSEEAKFLESYPENRKAYLSAMMEKTKAGQQANYKLDTGKLDPDSKQFNEFSGYLDVKAQMKFLKNKVKEAIDNNDTNAISLLGNQIAAVGSVANKQGVVNGEEVNRVLGAVQATQKMITDGKWVGQDAIRLGKELWGGLNVFADIVDGGINEKLKRYKSTYEIPDSFFQKSGIELENTVTSPSDIISPERQDKAIARATAFDTLKRVMTTGGTISNTATSLMDSVFGTNFTENFNSGKFKMSDLDAAIKSYYENEEKLYKKNLERNNPSAPAPAPAPAPRRGLSDNEKAKLERLESLDRTMPPNETRRNTIKALRLKLGGS